MNRSRVADGFLKRSIHHLEEDFLPRIAVCLEKLSSEQVWWRPNPQSNSVGNLLLHLEGNVRQWIVSGLGGSPDVRTRDREFAEKGPIPAGTLWNRLEKAVKEAVAVLEGLDEEELLRLRRLQIYEVSGLEAVLHVVEHFSYHTGQIVYVTKMLGGEDLKFYENL